MSTFFNYLCASALEADFINTPNFYYRKCLWQKIWRFISIENQNSRTIPWVWFLIKTFSVEKNGCIHETDSALVTNIYVQNFWIYIPQNLNTELNNNN